MVLARLFPDGGVCGGGWVGSTGKIRSAGGRGSQDAFWSWENVYAWERNGKGIRGGGPDVDRDPGNRLPRWSWRNLTWLDQGQSSPSAASGPLRSLQCLSLDLQVPAGSGWDNQPQSLGSRVNTACSSPSSSPCRSPLPGGTQHEALSCCLCPAHPPECHPI